MKNLLVVIALSLINASAFGQYDRNLHRVTPSSGPVDGGTLVTIEGEFTFQGILDPCTGPFVSVGGRAETVVSHDETKIVFTTRPYTQGTFDVKVEVCGATAKIKNAFTYGTPAAERYLLPVFLSHDVPGAHGSLWRTELGAYAEWPGMYTGDPIYTMTCTTPLPCPGDIGSERPFTPPVSSDQHTTGRLLYAFSNNPGHVTFNLRVRDVSRESESLGTELPVVPEDDAFGPYETFSLPNIPLGSLYRAKLRVYRLDALEQGDPVSLYSTDFVNPVVLTPTVEAPISGYQLYPGYAEIDLDTLPQLANKSRTNIVVGTPREGIYWAFVAVTNNSTQQITTVTPR